MPVLTMKEMARLDGRFFVESVVPALKAAGFEGSFSVALSDDSFRVEGDDVVIESTLGAFEALLQGKAKIEDAVAWRRKKGGPPALTVRASKKVLQRLAAIQSAAPKASASKDIGAEGDAAIKVRRMDRVRSADGRLIKGVRPGARRKVAPPSPPPPTAPVTMGTTDRVEFAVQNLARFAREVLQKVESVEDDANISFADGEVRSD